MKSAGSLSYVGTAQLSRVCQSRMEWSLETVRGGWSHRVRSYRGSGSSQDSVTRFLNFFCCLLLFVIFKRKPVLGVGPHFCFVSFCFSGHLGLGCVYWSHRVREHQSCHFKEMGRTCCFWPRAQRQPAAAWVGIMILLLTAYVMLNTLFLFCFIFFSLPCILICETGLYIVPTS